MKKIMVNGPIISNSEQWIYDYFDIEATSPKNVTSQLVDGEDIDININSGGGDVFAGSEIYTALKSHNGKVNVTITGIAASAASVIAMAGHTVKISPTAQIMIHNVSSGASGDYRDLAHQSEVIKNYNKSISASYEAKTGLEQSEILELMNKETWLTAVEAKEKGFADEILFADESVKLVASMPTTAIPQAVINKMLNSKATPTEPVSVALNAGQLKEIVAEAVSDLKKEFLNSGKTAIENNQPEEPKTKRFYF